jgi:hypothetical protein
MPPGDAAPAHAALDALLSRPAGEVFDALARRVLGKPEDLASLLAPVLGSTKPRYATRKNNPAKSAAWFDRARRVLHTIKLGREKAVLWEDAERLLESQRREPLEQAPKVQTQEDLDWAELEAAGARRRPGKGARK